MRTHAPDGKAKEHRGPERTAPEARLDGDVYDQPEDREGGDGERHQGSQTRTRKEAVPSGSSTPVAERV